MNTRELLDTDMPVYGMLKIAGERIPATVNDTGEVLIYDHVARFWRADSRTTPKQQLYIRACAKRILACAKLHKPTPQHGSNT
jgi:hypothetical protein